jgi:hypothetical protein
VATKAQLAKLEKALAETEAKLANVNKAIASAKPVVPTSGAVPGFKPQVAMPTPAKQPNQPGFVGPVAPALSTPSSVNPVSGAPTSGPVIGFTPPFAMPTPAANPGDKGFVGPVSITQPVKTEKPGPDSEMIDAFAVLAAQLRQWNLGSLADSFISLATQGFKPQEAMNKIKYDTSTNPATGKPWNADYTKRFSGNAARIKQGLNAYTETEYLQLEDSYADTLRKNNLTTLIGTNAESNQAQFAGYMEKGLSATEFADRIDEVSQRVIYANKETKDQFKEYFPALTDADIISYVLRPDIVMPILKTKIAAAEIGGVARQVGLGSTSLGMAETLAQAGVTKEEARVGYGQIAEFLPDAELYSQIYKQEGITYNKETAERDILLNQADATRSRKRLASMARASFEGSSGRQRTGRPQGNTGQF